MPSRVVITNALAGLTATGVTADTGYALSSLTDDVVARAFRNNAASTLHDIKIDRGASPVPVAWAGVFDLVGVTGGASAIENVSIWDSPDNITYTLRGRFSVNARGDGGMAVYAPQQWIQFEIQLSVSQKFDCGLLFAATGFSDFPKQFSKQQQSRDRGVVVNNTEGGGTFAGRLRSYREVLQLDWSVLDAAQHAIMVNIEEATGGEFTPFVLITDTAAGTLYHGRLEKVQTHTRIPGGVYEGHALAFRESGRAL